MRPDHAIDYLLERGLLTRRDLVRRGCRVQARYRRHVNLQVELGRTGGYFLKHASAAEPGAAGTLASEMDFYEGLAMSPGHGLPGIIPRFVLADRSGRILVLELEPETTSINEYVAERPDGLAGKLSADLGRAVASVHASPWTGLKRPVHQPWVAALPTPGPEILADGSPAQLDVVRIVQGHECLARCLTGLERSPTPRPCLVHGDLRWDNVLISSSTPGGGRLGRALVLVDWEFAACGAAHWDVAAVVAEYLGLWAAQLTGRSVSRQALLDSVPSTLRAANPAIRSFLRGYEEVRPLEPVEELAEFLAARLVQLAYEHSSDAARVAPRVIVLLQVAASLAEHRERALQLLLCAEGESV